jgi:hypothetical protein
MIRAFNVVIIIGPAIREILRRDFEMKVRIYTARGFVDIGRDVKSANITREEIKKAMLEYKKRKQRQLELKEKLNDMLESLP